jgi:L-malate glycosyltransferase
MNKGERQGMTAARILHLHSTFDLGGKEARAAKLMNHFGQNARHTVLTAVPGALGARDAIDPGIDVSYPGDSAPSLAGKPGLPRYRQLARYMQNFDLILSYNWGSMDGVMTHYLLGRKANLPALIHHEDGFNEDETERLNWKRNAFRRIALRRSYAMVVPSQILEGIARDVWRRPADKVIRIPNGIDVQRYARPCAPDAFPGLVRAPGEVIVGTVAGLRPVKNILRLVRAAAAAGPNIRLAIAGEGPERGAIMAQADSLGIAHRVVMGGFLSDPASFTGLFDIFALSSDSEQYPISLVEAMAAGLPAAATDVGDVRNIVSPANRDYIVARDDEALAGALRKLANDANLRYEIGRANQEIAVQHYEETEMFARYKNLYGQALLNAGRKNTDFTRQA